MSFHIQPPIPDRISLLPDDVLHHILSFLDIQELFKTTPFVSKQWKKLSISIPNLNFHYPTFLFSCHKPNPKICFRRFIKHALSHRPPFSNLNKLSLYFVTKPLGTCRKSKEILNSERFQKEDRILLKFLFDFVTSNHVTQLSINGGFLDFSDWSCGGFSTCRSLKLAGYFNTNWVPRTYFKFLNTLEIENYYSCTYFKPPRESEGEDEDMFAIRYPLLERLILRGSCFTRAKIIAPKLECLEMGSLRDFDYNGLNPEIWLSTPNLASVKLFNVVPTLVSFDDFPSLRKLEFCLHSNFSKWNFFDKVAVGKTLRSLMKLIQEPNVLTLNSVAVELLSKYVVPCGMEDEAFIFQKLKHLSLKGSITMPNHILSCLLKSPSLEKLHV